MTESEDESAREGVIRHIEYQNLMTMQIAHGDGEPTGAMGVTGPGSVGRYGKGVRTQA